jgi:hypothetical protein
LLGAKRGTGVPDEPGTDDTSTNNRNIGVVLQENKLATMTPAVKVVTPGTKTVNITKGFEVPPEKPETGKSWNVAHLNE